MRKFKKLSLVLSLVMLFTALFSGTVFAAPRLYGENRIETAIKIAEAGWPNGADTVIIAAGLKSKDAAKTATIFADALAGAPLAAALDAPILLVDANPNVDLDLRVRAALLDLAPSKVYVLGGPEAVSEAVVEQIKEDLGLADDAIVRIQGKNRYETSAAIANAVIEITGADEALVVDGLDFGEALAVASYAAKFGIPVVYREGLVDVDEVVVDGDIYELSAEYAAKFEAPAKVLLATGKAFADAFAAAPYAAKINAPVVLVGDELSDAAADFLASVAGADLEVLGGPNAVSEAIVAAAEEAMVVEEELKITSLAAVSAKSLKVVFNKPVEDTSKVTFTVKRDGYATSFADPVWNDAKTEATLNASYKLLTGQYVVTAKVDGVELTASAAVEESKVANIEFTTDIAVIDAKDPKKITATLKIYNQYGEDITSSAYSSAIIGTSIGNQATVNKDGLVTVTRNDQYEYQVDQKVVLTAQVGTVITSQVFTIAQAANIAEIVIGELTTSEADKNVYQSTDLNQKEYYFPVTVRDQYGNVLSLANITGQIEVRNLSESVAKATLTEKDGKTILKLITPDGYPENNGYGPAFITLTSKNGKFASVQVDVKEKSKVDRFDISPAGLLKEGKETVLNFEAYNQYGVKLTKASDIPINVPGGVTINVTNGQLLTNVDYLNDGALVLKVRPDVGAKQVVFTIITATAKAQQLTVAVEPAPVPTSFGGMQGWFKKALQLGEKVALDDVGYGVADRDDKIMIVKDQYGDNIDFRSVPGYSVVYEAVDGNADIVSYYVDENGNKWFKANDTTKGTETFVAKLLYTENNTTTVVDEYTFTMEAVDPKDITGYEIADFDKLYTGDKNKTSHMINYTVVGLKGDTKVVVPQTVVKAVSVPVTDIDVSTVCAGDFEDLYVIDINGGTWAGGDNLEVTTDNKLPIDNDVTYNGQPSLRIHVYQEGGAWWRGYIAFPPRDLTKYKDAYLQFAVKGEKGGETFGVGFKSGDPKEGTESRARKEVVATADWTVVRIPIKEYIEMDITPPFDPTEVTFMVQNLNNSALKAWIADVKIVSEPAADAVGTIWVKKEIDTEGADKTTKVNFIIEAESGTYTISKDLTYSSAAPVAQYLTIRGHEGWKKNPEVVTLNYDFKNEGWRSIYPGGWGVYFHIESKDQYNKNYKQFTFVISNKKDVNGNAKDFTVKFDSNKDGTGSGTLTYINGAAPGDSFYLTIITENGLMQSVKVVLTDKGQEK